MNKKRRTRLQKALSEAERLKTEVAQTTAKADELVREIETLSGEIEILQEEEQEAHDNLPDSIQWSEYGDAMQNIADALDDAKSSLEEASSSISEALNQ